MPEKNPLNPRESLLKYAVNILSRRPYLAGQLRQKLERRSMLLSLENVDGVITKIVSDLQKGGYLNDEYLISSYIRRQLSKSYGPKVISQKLYHMGVSKEESARYLKQEITPEAEKAAIEKILLKYRRQPPQKALAAVFRRGFSPVGLRFPFDCQGSED